MMKGLPPVLVLNVLENLDSASIKNTTLSCYLPYETVKDSKSGLAKQIIIDTIGKGVFSESILVRDSKVVMRAPLEAKHELAKRLQSRQQDLPNFTFSDASPLRQVP